MEQKPIPVLVRMPPALVRKLESTAKSQRRSRNTEACLRLEESFSKGKKKAGVS